MLHRYRFEILAVIAILLFGALFLYTSSRMPHTGFPGSDTVGSSQISKITGIPEEGFRPLIAQWVPPGSDIESALFALQAAVGGICVGWVFGYWSGLRKKEGEKE